MAAQQQAAQQQAAQQRAMAAGGAGGAAQQQQQQWAAPSRSTYSPNDEYDSGHYAGTSTFQQSRGGYAGTGSPSHPQNMIYTGHQPTQRSAIEKNADYWSRTMRIVKDMDAGGIWCAGTGAGI